RGERRILRVAVLRSAAAAGAEQVEFRAVARGDQQRCLLRAVERLRPEWRVLGRPAGAVVETHAEEQLEARVARVDVRGDGLALECGELRIPRRRRRDLLGGIGAVLGKVALEARLRDAAAGVVEEQ